jgi:hypothetical protein
VKKGIWIAFGLLLLAAIAATLILATSRGQDHPARVIEAFNKVDAHPRPQEEWEPALVDMKIYGGGQVRTGPASSARLELLEGNVRLSSDTVLTVKENATRQERLVTTLSLPEGRIWAHLDAESSHEFTVETGSAVAAVRDTRLSVRADRGETLLSVAEGQAVLTAQGQSVTVGTLEQATVQTGQPPGRPEPLSEEERALWATEGEMPDLALPKDMHVDVSCRLTGPAGDPASRRPETVFEVRVEAQQAAQVAVETPDGERIFLERFGDIFGEARRFHRSVPGLPKAGGTYTFTTLDGDGVPIPGAQARDVYVGGYEPDPPVSVRAEVVESGILVTWEPSPVIPGGFEPNGSPPHGFYQITLQGRDETAFGWNHVGRPLPETSHLIPLRRQDFGPGDRGQAIEEMADDIYYLSVTAFSLAPKGTAGRANECASRSREEIEIVIEAGQPKVR